MRHSVNRRKYTYTVAGRKEDFDFDRFSNEAMWQNNRLSTYIEDGDSINKVPNSAVLTLDRNGQKSEWTLVDTMTLAHEERSSP